MLPLTRIAREWRRLLVPLAVVAILNLLVYLFGVSPMSRSAAGAERRAQTARQALMRAQQEHARARAVISSSSQATENLGRFYGDVLPSDLAAARRMTYTRLAALAQETNLLYDRRSFEPDGSYRGSLGRLRITMELEGDYRDIREFIGDTACWPPLQPLLFFLLTRHCGRRWLPPRLLGRFVLQTARTLLGPVAGEFKEFCFAGVILLYMLSVARRARSLSGT